MGKIIDFHGHMGDIFATQKNVVFKQDQELPPGVYDPFANLSKNAFSVPLLDPSNPAEIENVIRVSFLICHINTLQNLGKALDENGIDYQCLYPIWPHITFEEYLAASKLDPRILPFTSAQWDLGDNVGKKLLEDVKKGAKGFKIHPILQPINLNDPRVDIALKAWEETGLPVVSHNGINSYYFEDLAHTQCPENGNFEDFIKMAKRFPNIHFVGAHAGGLTGIELDMFEAELAKPGAPQNIWVDTTFRNAEEIKRMIKIFGEDRVVYGSDRPFTVASCSLAEVYKALGKDSPVARKVLYENAAYLLKMQ